MFWSSMKRQNMSSRMSIAANANALTLMSCVGDTDLHGFTGVGIDVAADDLGAFGREGLSEHAPAAVRHARDEHHLVLHGREATREHLPAASREGASRRMVHRQRSPPFVRLRRQLAALACRM